MLTAKRGRVDEDLLMKLESASIKIDRELCYDTNPMLQVIYKRYTVANQVISQVADMINDRSWPKELGKPPNQTEIVCLFVAKTTWNKTYAKLLPCAEGYQDMRSWLEDPDTCSDQELWGETKSRYTISDLSDWLNSKDKASKKRKGKEKEKEKEASGSAKEKVKEKPKVVVSESKKSHKKKRVG